MINKTMDIRHPNSNGSPRSGFENNGNKRIKIGGFPEKPETNPSTSVNSEWKRHKKQHGFYSNMWPGMRLRRLLSLHRTSIFFFVSRSLFHSSISINTMHHSKQTIIHVNFIYLHCNTRNAIATRLKESSTTMTNLL